MCLIILAFLIIKSNCFLVRSIFFGIVWMVTMGKYHIWFLPNLLADVGFFESFKPVYTIEIKNNGLFLIFDDIFEYFLLCEINLK